MSALSNTNTNKDTLSNNFLNSKLKEGKKYLLKRNFALGEGWSKEKVQFAYQYSDLLCNLSPDINSYFNLKLLPYLNAENQAALNELSATITAVKSCVPRLTSSSSRIDYILGELCTIDEFDSISKVIYVTDANIAPFYGSLEAKISSYINSLGYVKEDIESEIWIEYIGTLWS